MSLKTKVSPKLVSLVFGILVGCFVVGFYILAWTEPTASPPAENVPLPLNVSNIGQVKEGGLIIHSSSSFLDPAQPYALLVPYGYVGIGTTNPQYTLDVEGDAQANNWHTGDIFFQKNNENLWRMFEDEDGLYAENLKTGKVYRFILEEVSKE